MQCKDCKCTTKPNASIVIKFACETETTRECPVCMRQFYMAGKTWAYLENTTTPVCLNCAGPELAALLDAKARQDGQIDEAMDRIRATKIEHYREHEPMLFYQVYGIADDPIGEKSPPDEFGTSIYGGETWELMGDTPEARLLLRADLTVDQAKRAVASISGAVTSGFIGSSNLAKDIPAEAVQYAKMLIEQDLLPL